MNLYAGIDGGQSSTVALVADERGRVLGHGHAGPCDDVGEAPDSRRLADALETALAGALRAGGIDPGAELAAVVAGISGYEGSIHGAAPVLHARRIRFVHDAPAAHAGAFALGPGIVLIAGTGSVAYGTSAQGRSMTVGGWGYLFGDEGSAFAIARTALARAMEAEDSGDRSAIGEAALARFGAPSLRTFVRAFYTGGIDRPALAAFAPEVLRLAASDPAARAVRDEAAADLGSLARACALRLGADEGPKIALAGGLFAEESFRAEVVAAVRRALPKASVVERAYDPAAGALLLAFREAGVEPPRLEPAAAGRP